jgi:dolichol-phosphate mannosyltransferase
MNGTTVKKYFREIVLTPRTLKFGIVGSSGVLVNMGVLYLLTEFFGVFYLVSSIIAIEVSILSNFLLNDNWTWHDRKPGHIVHRAIKYHVAAGLTAVVVNWLLLLILTEVFHLYYLVSNIIGIGCGMISNFIVNDLWTFRSKQSE